MIRKEILAKRNKIKIEIDLLNSMRYEEEIKGVNQKIKELKERYNYYNNLLKVIK